MSISNLPPLTPTDPPRNPLSDGKFSQVITYMTLGGIGLTALFFILDTIQVIATGHESVTFISLAKGVAGIGLGSLVVMLIRMFVERSN